jgi:Family of unknown function (DUF6428)
MTQTERTQNIPGLGEHVETHILIEGLRAQAQLPLEFWLNGEVLVGPGYHVTEVKAVSIEAMDCGGKAATWRETVIQLMDGSAAEVKAGFMRSGKFLSIYDQVTRKIPVRAEAEVRFEYGNTAVPAMQYHVTGMDVQPERLIVHLRTPGVQCKAGEACGVSADTSSADQGCGCAPTSDASACCTPATAQLVTLS